MDPETLPATRGRAVPESEGLLWRDVAEALAAAEAAQRPTWRARLATHLANVLESPFFLNGVSQP